MTRDDIFSVCREEILAVLPDLDPAQITEDRSMRDLGANSIDRADVVLQVMDRLGVSCQLSELAEVRNIGGLIDVLHAKLHAG